MGGPGAFGGASGPQQQAGPPANDECMKHFLPLRQDAEKKAGLIKAAGARKAPPDEACKLIASFASAEVKMINFIETNAKKCGIPPEIGQQMKTGHVNTEKNENHGVQRGPAARTGRRRSRRAEPERGVGRQRGAARGAKRQARRRDVRNPQRQRVVAVTACHDRRDSTRCGCDPEQLGRHPRAGVVAPLPAAVAISTGRSDPGCC